MQGTDRLCVGVVVGTHGVRGLLRVKSFTATPEDLTAYGPLTDEAGAVVYPLEVKNRTRGVVLCTLAGVEDRDAAQALKGTRLFVSRAALPPAEDDDEFYHADLIGLSVVFEEGESLGTVSAVYDFGAGDVLELRTPGGKVVMLPFTRRAIPVVDLPNRRLVAARLPGLLEDAAPEPTEADGPKTEDEDAWPDEDWR